MNPLDELRKTLASLYYVQKEIVALLLRAHLAPEQYQLDERAIVVWGLLLKQLTDQGQGKFKQLMNAALEDYPDNPVLLAVSNNLPAVNSAYSGPSPNYTPISPAEARSLEKIMGQQNTLLPISFLQKGTQAAAAVARIVTPNGMGTGFLVSAGSQLLTNNHVFPDAATAAGSKVQFNYQQGPTGLPLEIGAFQLDPVGFETCVDNDWSLVRVKGDPVATYGFFTLSKQDVKVNDFVNIIQHPGGELKQIAMYHNLVTFTNERVLQYLTDTMPGSSGSPVLNSKWDVVGLHNSGGWIEQPGLSTPVLRNQGIRVNRILDDFAERKIKL